MISSPPSSATPPQSPARQTPDAKTGGDNPIVQVKDVAAEYGGKVILQNINFEVRRREVLVIAGESGSGKSTLLRRLVGLEAPSRGQILVEGEDLTVADREDRRRIFRKIGVAFQSGALFGSMSMIENVALPLIMFTRLSPAMVEMVALTKLQLVGLAADAQKKPAELSGGMQKRGAIARALALDPEILFLDEPSAGLDPFASAELDQLVLTLRRLLNTTFVIISHHLASIFTIADRVLLLNGEKGTIVAEGDPRTLRDSSTDPWVHAFFNRQTLHKNPPGQTLAKESAVPGAIEPDPSGRLDASHEYHPLL